MPVDLVVTRCTLTIRRRDGWSWGRDPRGHVRDGVDAIERALLDVLAEADLPADVEVRLPETVRLDLAADGTPTHASRTALVRALREAVPAPPPPEPPAVIGVGAADGADLPWRPTAEPGGPAAAAALARALAGWSSTGRLAQLVALWPAAVVTRWLVTAQDLAADPAVPTATLTPAAVSRIAEMVVTAPDSDSPSQAQRRLLVLLGALVTAAGDRLPSTETLRTAGGLAGAPPVTLDRPRNVTRDDAEAATQVPGAVSAPRPAADRPEDETPRSVVVRGLPFLTVVQLARLGFLDALQATAATAGTPYAAQVLVAALAGKVLPPPERGWRRTPDDVRSVLVASDLGAAELAAGTTALLAAADVIHPPLATALVAMYADGRSHSDTLHVSETDHGQLCGEAAGLLPLAWVATADALDPVLDQLGRPPVASSPLFAPLAAELAPRRGFPGQTDDDLERLFGAAVGTALGSLATELWGDAEACSPLLALHRFADLEVQVTLGDGLTIGVPRGQRWLDLRRCGLLDTWPAPWAPGGSWELVTW
jgi:hypothetical protein